MTSDLPIVAWSAVVVVATGRGAGASSGIAGAEVAVVAGRSGSGAPGRDGVEGCFVGFHMFGKVLSWCWINDHQPHFGDQSAFYSANSGSSCGNPIFH